MTDDTDVCIVVAPSGLTCNEVTASSLVKLSLTGAVVDAGNTGLDVDMQSLSLHSALYECSKRLDIKCIVHITSCSAISVRDILLLGEILSQLPTNTA